MKLERKTKNETRIITQDNLENKKQKTLLINCNNCDYHKEDINLLRQKECKLCFFKNLNLYTKKNIDFIRINSLNLVIERHQFLTLLQYFKKVPNIKKKILKIKKYRQKRCSYKFFNCRAFSDFWDQIDIKNRDYLDPLFIFKKTVNLYKKISVEIEQKNDISPSCINCMKNINKEIISILKMLSSLKIVKEFQNFDNTLEKSNEYYEMILFRSNYTIESDFISEDPIKIYKSKIIKEYSEKIGINEIKDFFDVKILEILELREKIYQVQLNFESEEKISYYNVVIHRILKKLDTISFNKIIPLQDLIEIYKDKAMGIINSEFKLKISNRERNILAYYSSLKKINLNKLFPLLIDDSIEEIFLDSPYDRIYINHQKFGRCLTNFSFSPIEIERIKTLLRLHSGRALDSMNPSASDVIQNKYFYIRIAIDTITNIENFSLDIRKLYKNIFTIQDLIKNKTLNPTIATFLYFCILKRANLTVTGETDTGKTTLINAFDLLTPKEFRKIYVESEIESLKQSYFHKHQLKFKVDSYTNVEIARFSKENHIKTLLHRTPDLIFLGEILEEEECKALFHCLSAGLRGFQTIHARDVDSLMNRFLKRFKIDESSLNDLDLIILMKKTEKGRKIVCISEIDNKSSEGKYYRNIFEYNPNNNNWEILVDDLYKANTISRIIKYEDINKDKFDNCLIIFKDIFEWLSNRKRIDPAILISLFHQISYYSQESNQELKNFWIKFKNSGI